MCGCNICQIVVWCCDGMSVLMEETNSADPREEVKKLQEMVRKLEQQNQQLLNNWYQQNNWGSRAHQNGTERNRIFDEVDLINIEDLDLSDEDSWLYLSPKGLSPEEKAVDTYKWLRKDVEDPYNRELQMARRALVYKLDELAILSPPGNHLHERPPFGHGVDSRTFTRPKKKREDFPDGLDEQQPRVSRGKMDFINVQEIARMQEESLRQSSPGSTPKRNSIGSQSSSGRRLSTSSRNSTDSETQLETSQASESTNKPVIDVFPENRSDSSHSSPAGSPQGSSPALDNGINHSFRSSAPNLAKGNCEKRMPVKLTNKSRVESPSRIGTYSAGLSPIRGGERRLVARSATNLRSISPNCRTRVLSPEPATRGSTVRTPPSRIARIPSPKTRSSGIPSRIARPAQNSWNDGCF